MSDELTFDDITFLLRKFDGLDIVLVGGQAVAFWVEQYIDRLPELLEQMPFTSKDVDFCGDRGVVAECAGRVGGEPIFPELDDPTPNSGMVLFIDSNGTKHEIDILRSPLGVTREETLSSSIVAELPGDSGEAPVLRLRVMHPVLLMLSRVTGLMTLGDTAASRKKLRASVLCAREFLRDRLDEGHIRPVLKLQERIFEFSQGDLNGRQIVASTGIDPFEAVLLDERLPVAFRERRYPQMLEAVRRARSKIAVPG